MSYCRFRNTDNDLADCQEALEELFAGQLDPLSRDELRAAKNLVMRCLEIALGVADRADEDLDELQNHDIAGIIDDANARTRREERS